MGTAQSESSSFNSSAAAQSLSEACREAGLSSDRAELIRLGENAIYRLANDPIVVRIGRNSDILPDAKKEVAVASWLRDSGLPAAEPTGNSQPVMACGRPVTFWRLIQDSGTKANLAELAQALRRLHSLPVPEDLPLPKFDIFGRTAQRIEKADCLSSAERSFLSERLTILRKECADLKFTLPSSAIHGDAHQSNLIQTPDGDVFLIDFEAFAYGPPEYDLSVTATEQGVGWHSDEQYETFVSIYGFDVKDWEGFPVVRAINELKMTTWLMQNVDESVDIAHEFRNRLSSLHDIKAPRQWSPF